MNKITELLKELNLNKNQLSNLIGVSSGLLNEYEKGIKNPGRKFIEKLKAKIPNLNEAYFFSDDAPMFKTQETVVSHPANSIKIYERVAAGQPIILWDEPIDIVEITHPILKKRKDLFGFLVSGDSMLPRFHNGDYVITQKLNLPNELPRNRDYIVTVFRDSSEANLKRFQWLNKSKGNFLLIPLNSLYETSQHNLKDVSYMFRVYLNISQIDYKKE